MVFVFTPMSLPYAVQNDNGWICWQLYNLLISTKCITGWVTKLFVIELVVGDQLCRSLVMVSYRSSSLARSRNVDSWTCTATSFTLLCFHLVLLFRPLPVARSGKQAPPPPPAGFPQQPPNHQGSVQDHYRQEYYPAWHSSLGLRRPVGTGERNSYCYIGYSSRLDWHGFLARWNPCPSTTKTSGNLTYALGMHILNYGGWSVDISWPVVTSPFAKDSIAINKVHLNEQVFGYKIDVLVFHVIIIITFFTIVFTHRRTDGVALHPVNLELLIDTLIITLKQFHQIDVFFSVHLKRNR